MYSIFKKKKTLKVKWVYVGINSLDLNLQLFWEKQRCSSNKKRGGSEEGIRISGWLDPLSIIPVSSAAPPTDAQRHRSLHRQWYSKQLRLVCSYRRKRGEKKSTSPPQTASEVGRRRQKATEERARREEKRLWSKKQRQAAAWTSSEDRLIVRALL